jgi:nitric oxide dioxygenase
LCGTKAGRAIRYVHGADSRELAAFVPEITALAADNALKADFFYAKDKALDEVVGAGVTRHAGRVSTEWLREVADPAATYYICGPESFMQDMIGTLHDAGLPAAQIRYEIFGSASNPDLVL